MIRTFPLFGLVILLSLAFSESQTSSEIQDLTIALQDENPNEPHREWNTCDVDTRSLKGGFDFEFVRNFFVNLFRTPTPHMRFVLFRQEFPDCGRVLNLDDDKATLLGKGFKPNKPTRIIIHGWLSQRAGTFNSDIKIAYLNKGDFNVIIADWSDVSATLNYFAMPKMIQALGSKVAEFSLRMSSVLPLSLDDIYLVGHSLGAHIAGAAGKLVQPQLFNTIFALDPAGPLFRKLGIDLRIDPTDAKYVESIQTSAFLGFSNPTGHATFYPNWGDFNKLCFFPGCSHMRAYKMFAESINSKKGFWGKRCSQRDPKWVCETQLSYQMGGEPSTPKSGVFYVTTNSESPYAQGQ